MPAKTRSRTRRPSKEETPKGKHWCSVHKRFEPRSAFGKNRSEKSGLMSMCKDADREIQRKWRKARAVKKANEQKAAKAGKES